MGTYVSQDWSSNLTTDLNLKALIAEDFQASIQLILLDEESLPVIGFGDKWVVWIENTHR
jgi:hypothetical protein